MVVGLLGAAAPARADFNIQTGLKWVPLRYTRPVSTVGAPGAPVPTDLYGWQTTSLDNYLAFYFTEQIGIQLSLDFGYASHHDDTNAMNNLDMSFTQVGFALGGKFYLNRPTRERVSPYIYADFFKYFAGVSTSVNLNNDQVAFVAALASPVGFDLAFGAEYFFTTSFSLGAEVLGLRLAYVSGGYDVGNGNIHHESDLYTTLYTGVTLNYRFLATASVHTYEEEEDAANPRPKRKKKKVAPPPDDSGEGAAPPSPESVD